MAISKIVTNSVDSGVTLTSPVMNTITSAAATNLTLQSAGTTAVTIDTSQNVGIGTTSPTVKLQITAPVVNNAVSVAQIVTNAGTGNAGSGIGLGYGTGNGYYAQLAGVYDNTGSAFTVSTSALNVAAAERMRIDSSGTVLMGQTTNPATATLVIKVPTGTANGINAQITSNTGTSYPFSNYNASSAYVGGISCTSSATAFGTSSDARLKKNITDAPSAISKVLTAKVVSHDWINDGHHVEYGFVAQDLQDIIPQAVIEGTNKEDGSMDMPWGVDYSKIVPLLVKSIQEQQALILALTTRISALEAK